MKKILIIKSHPKKDSFCNALVEKYIEGTKKSGNKIEIIDLKNLNLEKYLKYEHKGNPKLSPDLLDAQKLIKWADHLVFAYSTWWGTPPALLKVFIEIVFESGFAYKYPKSGKSFKIDKLLTGKSARLIATMDIPPLFNSLFGGDSGGKMMKRAVLNFCGVKPVYKNYFGSVKLSSEEKRKKWLEKVYEIGVNE